MSAFDEWVQEAPFRHLGVFALVILAAVALCLGGCSVPSRANRCEAYVKHVSTEYEHFRGGAVDKTVVVTNVCVKETTVIIY